MITSSDIVTILLSAVGLILLSGSIFYLITAWNVKKPWFKYDYFPTVSLMAYAWQSGNVIERKITIF